VKRSKPAACTIYHNPRCSKSRATLSLLEDQGIAPTVIEYLKTPLNANAIRSLLNKLSMEPLELARKGEMIFQELFADKTPTSAQLIAAMAAHPELIERPIVVVGDRAALGRPPENVLRLLK
jgi:arsenate reductase